MKKDQKNEKHTNNKNTSKFRIQDENAIQFEDRNKEPQTSSKKDLQSNKKKKVKNLEDTPTMLKGRYQCNCETRKHGLINNCLKCGRIVCEQEGSGPCYICGNLVCTPQEQAQFNGDTSKAAKLYEQLLTKKKPQGLEEALKHRDKLLDFDKNTRKHTHVFDDDSDYFCASNPWLTLEQRESMKKKEEEYFNKKYESQRFKKITINLQNQQIQNENVKVIRNDYQKEEVHTENAFPNQILDDNIVDQLVDPFFAPLNIKFNKLLQSDLNKKIRSAFSTEARVMDTEIERIVDDGYCISIHQPLASFLVHGIRTGEGRTWYTSHRGKLWIASTGLRMLRDDIENAYLYIKKNVKFPSDYPFGCLLGCVDLVDCLSQEQYRNEFPEGEIEDPYVLICENPQPLTVRYPIKGKPNIYKLDENIHKAAITSLKLTKGMR